MKSINICDKDIHNMESSPEYLDYLNIQSDADVLKIIGSDEPIIYSERVSKINQYSFSQKRILIITTLKLYNFRERGGKKQLKRVIPIGAIGGISKSLAKKSKEFVIHVPEQYDYRYQTERREDIIQSLKTAYVSLMKENLPIYGIDAKDLKSYTTTERDRIKNKSRIPGKEFLIPEENVYDKDNASLNQPNGESNEASADETKDESSNWDTENYLKTSFRASTVISDFDVEFEDDDKLIDSKHYRSSTLYSRTGVED